MHPPDLRKLIAGFLVLSAITSSGALLFSRFLANPTSVLQRGAETAGPAQISPRTKNAFVESLESLPALVHTNGGGETLRPNAIPASNLTDRFADVLAQQIVEANPLGPGTVNGEPAVTAPDPELLFEQLASSRGGAIVDIPDWETEVADAVKKTNPAPDTPEARSAYGQSINALLEKYLIKTGLLARISPSSPVTDLALALPVLQEAVRDVSTLSPPESYRAFHKSFLAILIYQKNLLAAGEEVTRDPLKAVFIFQAHEARYLAAIHEFERELERAPELQSLSRDARPSASFIVFVQSLVLPKTAHALFGIEGWAQLAQMILEWLRKLVTEILKDQLIHRLVQQVIKWVQGEGKPQFVTNWRQFLEDSFSRAAGAATQKLTRLCGAFGPLVQIGLAPPANIYEPTYCTLDQVVQNIEGFYDDFSRGGWVAYGAALQPQNNLFGAMIISSDIVTREAAKAQEAERTKALAWSGFPGTKQCVKFREESFPIGEFDLDILRQDEDFVRAGSCSQTTCTAVFCDDDDGRGYRVTTPGEAIGSQLDQALGSPIHRIVNAEDIIALVSALVNSGLNKLTRAGQRGLTGLLRGGADSSEAVGTGSGNPSGPCADLAPASGQAPSDEYLDCLDTTRPVDRSTSGADLGVERTNFINQAQNLIQILEKTVDANSKWLGPGNSYVAGVRSALANLSLNVCQNPEIAANANQRSERLLALTPVIEVQLAATNLALANIQNIRQELDAPNLTPTQLNDILGRLNSYNAATLSNDADDAEKRFRALLQLDSDIAANLETNEATSQPWCNVPLTAIE